MAEKVVVIAGPTATGKTRLGIELAQKLGGEIVSADSMQVYRRMDIGTAKADFAERTAAVHHMLDVAEPDEDYSVARYVEDASLCCDDILSRGKLPIIVGGTGLYIDSLISGRYFAARDDSDEELREKLGTEYDQYGGENMLQRLRNIDPERANRLHSADKRRIVRALEIYMLTGITATEHDRQTRELPYRYDASTIVLSYKNREDLYARINRRVDEMISRGLFDEVSSLLADLPADCTAMQAIGYKEAILSLRGEIGRDEAVMQIKQNSRRYAKRQLTWFSRYKDALWLRWDSEPDFENGLRLSTEFLLGRGIS